jgi:hypothetical protein
MGMGQSAYENATNSVARSGMKTGDAGFIANQIGKGLNRLGAEATKKHKANVAKEAQAAKEAKAAAKEAAKVKPKKPSKPRKPKTFIPTRSPAAIAADKYKPTAAKKPAATKASATTKVLNRQQHFESAVGNSKDTPAKPAPRPTLDTEQASFYND